MGYNHSIELNYRTARKSDKDQIIKLVHPMWIRHGKEEPTFLRKDYLEKYNISEYFDKIFEDSGNHVVFIAEDKRTVVGVVHGEVVEVDKMFTTQKVMYADDMAVHKEYKKEGHC